MSLKKLSAQAASRFPLHAGNREQLQKFFANALWLPLLPPLAKAAPMRNTIELLHSGHTAAAGVMVGITDGSPMVITVGTPVGMPAVSFNISRSVGPSIN